MLETGKISPAQMAFMMHPTILTTAIFYGPAITIRIAGTDTWLVPFFSALVALLSVYVMINLHAKYPKLTFIEYCPRILGRWLGQSLGFVYLLSLLYSFGIVLREYGEFIVSQFLVKTPQLVVVVCLVALCAYAVHMGLEVLARSSQIIVPFAMSVVIILVLLLTPDMKINEFLPLMENGVRGPLLGSIAPAAWFSQYFVLGFLLPYFARQEQALKWSLISVSSVVFTLIVFNLSVQLVFGSLAGNMEYPFLKAIRFVSVGDILQHLEALLMAIWMLGIFLKVATLYYVLTLGTAQWLHLSNYRLLIVPFGVLGILYSMWVSGNLQELTRLLEYTLPFNALLMQLIIPLVLLLIAVARRRSNHMS